MIVPGITFVQGRNSYGDADGAKYGIAIHDTSNSANAAAEAAYATRRTDGVSSHFYVDGKTVIQSLDTAARAGHAGSRIGNENAICVEITGLNGWTRQQWLSNVAWDKLAVVLRQVIAHHWPDGSFQVRRATVAEMRANPKVRALYGHDDMRQAWGGTDHTDPGPNFPWDHLLSLIQSQEADMTPDEHNRLYATDERIREALITGSDEYDDDGMGMTKPWIVRAVKQLLADVKALQTGGVDVDAIAEAVADKLAARLKE